MMGQAILLGGAGAFWILARLFQPMPPWAVPAMWMGVIAVAVGPFLIGVPSVVMEEVILPVCAGFAGGEWTGGMILARRLKNQKAAKEAAKVASRRKRSKQD